jgi:L-histidine Nalpha-methyltransferase / hercynylcysteine S-oxide synthase
MPFHLDPSRYASFTVPTLEDWRGLWAAWDTVTRGMIPNDELLHKPIKLRNACIFYLGHIPTFLDIQLSKATKDPLCEPSYYPKIFERGIDPDVDNPELCHAHSEIPEEWPPLQEILGYQTQVREKVERMYDDNAPYFPRNIGRSLWIGFEHEIMHLETLMYMLLQSDRTLPPPRTIAPDFEKDAELAAKASVPNQWFIVPEQRITMGLNDPDDNSGPDSYFGWYEPSDVCSFAILI